ncbi:MAG TPA: MgtC/SapB family protein [Clostridia bacterium]|nr:MgtC/SapB family protein [Clostridia bacterium]
MGDILSALRSLTLFTAAFRLLLATMLGGFIGMERGRRGRAAGMRTHILVCLGAALSALIGLYTTEVLDFGTDPLRVGAQVISGIGFLGAGMILIRSHTQVMGLTTAAGLWATAAIGLAIGIGYYEAALLTMLLVIITNALFPFMERNIKVHRNPTLYLELKEPEQLNAFLLYLKEYYKITAFHIIPPKSGFENHLGLEVEVPLGSETEATEICHELTLKEQVVFAVEMSQQGGYNL